MDLYRSAREHGHLARGELRPGSELTRSDPELEAILLILTDHHGAELAAYIVHPPEDGEQFAPGYYSVLFEDPEGIRVEVNFVPGRGHLGPGGRLGPDGTGPAEDLAG